MKKLKIDVMVIVEGWWSLMLQARIRALLPCEKREGHDSDDCFRVLFFF